MLSSGERIERHKVELPAACSSDYLHALEAVTEERRSEPLAPGFLSRHDELSRRALPATTAPKGNRLQLVDLAGFLYAVSLHKFAAPATTPGGYSALISAGAVIASFLCVFLASWKNRRSYPPSPAMICLAIVGVLALASSWRSPVVTVSIVQGVLYLLVLATCYLLSQSGLDGRYLRSVYRSYVSLLALGLVAGVLFPHIYPLLTFDDYTQRTTFSVFHTFFGVLGEDAALMVLIAPLVFDRPLWISGAFLIAMNLMAGSKTPTIILVSLLLIRFLSGLRHWRSWRSTAVVLGLSCLGCFAIYSSYTSELPSRTLGAPAQALYGKRVAEDATSFDGRLGLWKRAVELFPTVPVFGYGFDGDRDLMLQVAKWSGSAHNSYLEVALSSGLIGLGFLAIAAASILSSCLKAPPGVLLALLSLLAFLAAQSIMGIVFYNPSFIGLFLLAWCSYRAQRSESLPPPNAPFQV